MENRTHSLKNVQGAPGRERSNTGNNSYKGIPMFCDIQLHEKCFEQIQKLNKDPKVRVLVLGSGGGAFDQRLSDSGYSDITSTDFRPDFFRAKGTKFTVCDLNQDFSHLGTFDVIVGIEIIEHLENTAHFLHNVTQCLAPNGFVIITTPNIESGLSRANFLTTGRLSFFTKADLLGSGHITPIFDHLFRFHSANAGLTVITRTNNRNAWVARYRATYNECVQYLKHPTLRNILRIFILIAKSASVLFWPLTRFNAHDGNINIYIIKK